MVPGVSQLSSCKFADLTHEGLRSCKTKYEELIYTNHILFLKKEVSILIKPDCITAVQICDFTLQMIFQWQAYKTVTSSVLGLQPTSQSQNDFRIIKTDALNPVPIKTTVTLQVPSASFFHSLSILVTLLHLLPTLPLPVDA